MHPASPVWPDSAHPLYSHLRRKTGTLQRSDSDLHADTVRNGYLLLFGTGGFFVFMMYLVVVSKYMPETGHPVLDFFRSDMYYSLLVPCTLISTVFAVYLNWLGLKFFRHN